MHKAGIKHACMLCISFCWIGSQTWLHWQCQVGTAKKTLTAEGPAVAIRTCLHMPSLSPVQREQGTRQTKAEHFNGALGQHLVKPTVYCSVCKVPL